MLVVARALRRVPTNLVGVGLSEYSESLKSALLSGVGLAFTVLGLGEGAESPSDSNRASLSLYVSHWDQSITHLMF